MKRIKRQVFNAINNRWRFGLMVLPLAGVALVLLWSGVGKWATAADDWHLAAEAAPTGLMHQVEQENLTATAKIDPGQMKVWQIQLPNQPQPLYLIDTRITHSGDRPSTEQTNPLCGAAGCEFLGYIPTDSGFQQVWSAYLDVHLPPGIPLFESPTEVQAGLPVLMVNQMQDGQVERSTWSFNGQEYEITETMLTPKTY